MFSNAKILFESLSESLSWRRLNTESNKNARLLEKIDTTSSAANQLFNLTTIDYSEPGINEKHKITYSEIIYDSLNDLDSTMLFQLRKEVLI